MKPSSLSHLACGMTFSEEVMVVVLAEIGEGTGADPVEEGNLSTSTLGSALIAASRMDGSRETDADGTEGAGDVEAETGLDADSTDKDGTMEPVLPGVCVR